MNTRRIIRISLVVLGFGLALMLPATAFAVFASINTDDAAIDADWASVGVFLTSPNEAMADGVDIAQAKVVRESDNSYWYFQVILYGQLPQDNLTSLEAHVSCDGNAVFTGAEDKYVLYYHANPSTNDNVIECEGNDYPACSNGEMLKGSDFGEEVAVGDGTYAYEWRTDIANPGGISWTTCNGQETLQFAVADASGTTYDSTTTRQFDVPTAIQMQSLVARGSAPGAMPGIAIALGGVAALGLTLGLWRRNRHA